MIWPFAGDYYVTRQFGFKSSLYYGGMHAAIDIVKADGPTLGAPVLAIADGTLVAGPYDRLSGNNCYIQHPDGWRSGYRHFTNQRWPVGVPIAVKQGQEIGYAGNTGASTGPHLHLDLWHREQQSPEAFAKLGWWAHDPELYLGKEDAMEEITLVASDDPANKGQLAWTAAIGFRAIEFADLLVVNKREAVFSIKVYHVVLPEAEWRAAAS